VSLYLFKNQICWAAAHCALIEDERWSIEKSQILGVPDALLEGISAAVNSQPTRPFRCLKHQFAVEIGDPAGSVNFELMMSQYGVPMNGAQIRAEPKCPHCGEAMQLVQFVAVGIAPSYRHSLADSARLPSIGALEPTELDQTPAS